MKNTDFMFGVMVKTQKRDIKNAFFHCVTKFPVCNYK